MDEKNFDVSNDVSGVLIQYPATDGSISDYSVSFLFCPLLMLAFPRDIYTLYLPLCTGMALFPNQYLQSKFIDSPTPRSLPYTSHEHCIVNFGWSVESCHILLGFGKQGARCQGEAGGGH